MKGFCLLILFVNQKLVKLRSALRASAMGLGLHPSIVLIGVTLRFYFWVALFPVVVKLKSHFSSGFIL